MYIIKRTQIFADWLDHLADPLAIVAITKRIMRAEKGNFGDHKSVGNGIYEMRLDISKGYRLYYA